MFNKEKANVEMDQQGRSNKWVARELNMDAITIGRYLSGKIPCPKAVAIAWATKMGLPAEAFWAVTQDSGEAPAA